MLNTRSNEWNTVTLFISSLVDENSNLECVRVQVNQAEYGIRILVAASHEYTNTYSIPRILIAVACPQIYLALGLTPICVCVCVCVYICIHTYTCICI